MRKLLSMSKFITPFSNKGFSMIELVVFSTCSIIVLYSVMSYVSGASRSSAVLASLVENVELEAQMQTILPYCSFFFRDSAGSFPIKKNGNQVSLDQIVIGGKVLAKNTVGNNIDRKVDGAYKSKLSFSVLNCDPVNPENCKADLEYNLIPVKSADPRSNQGFVTDSSRKAITRKIKDMNLVFEKITNNLKSCILNPTELKPDPKRICQVFQPGNPDCTNVLKLFSNPSFIQVQCGANKVLRNYYKDGVADCVDKPLTPTLAQPVVGIPPAYAKQYRRHWACPKDVTLFKDDLDSADYCVTSMQTNDCNPVNIGVTDGSCVSLACQPNRGWDKGNFKCQNTWVKTN